VIKPASSGLCCLFDVLKNVAIDADGAVSLFKPFFIVCVGEGQMVAVWLL
jgi:hypothetical protein